jgi:hypothetical protein
METLILEGVRCFGERQQMPIRPVTLLVGENSTGKSTVLAMVRAAWDLAHGSADPDFNEEPFDLGGYDAIAHRGGKGQRAEELCIAASFLTRGALPGYRVTGTFVERAGQPSLTEWEAQRGDTKLRFTFAEGASRLVLERADAVLMDEVERSPLRAPKLLSYLVYTVLERRRDAMAGPVLDMMPDSALAKEPRPVAGAPIRSKPIRTYNPRREVREPEGSHVPMELSALHGTSPQEFTVLAEQLAVYGADANLFTKLQVKRLGKKVGDPFQLLVAVDRRAFNLRDVGYGVSQVLPILVDTLAAPKGQTFLLQQPEVHLHPRAQAALGSLFVEQAARRKQTFVVETHSDYLVDRVRMDIRDRRSRLRAQDIVILYFERVAGRATVHPITIDDKGNLLGVPFGYRRFFLEEERRLLGI